MIAPLRRRHALIWTGLAIGLPLALFAGLRGRTGPAVMPALPAVLAAGPAPNRHAPAEQVRFDGRPEYSLQWWRAPGTNAPALLELIGPDATPPDLLLYAVPASPARPVTGLPADARLLGAFVPGAFLPWPADLAGLPGRLALYSLVDQEVVTISQTHAPNHRAEAGGN